MGHGDAVTPIRTQEVRTAPNEQRPHSGAASSVQDTANCPEPAHANSVRTQQANSTDPNDRAPTGPGGWARQAVADYFDRAIEQRWDRNEYWASNRALAKPLRADEKTVRHVRDGRKVLSVAMLLVLPAPLVFDVTSWVNDKRALSDHRRGLPLLKDALDRIEAPIAAEDRDEAMRSIADAQRRLTERMCKLATEGR